MTCREVDDVLDDYVDGTLPEGEFQEVELHLSTCESCRKAERGLRRLLAEAAALPREKSPERDLWPEIRAQLGSRAMPGTWWMGLAAAAALVLAVAGGYFLRGDSGRTAIPGPAPATQPVAFASRTLADAEEDYARASDELLAALHERRDSFAPETIESVEKNLAVIDAALAEVREALRHDPENPELTRMLAATHRKKVDVLRRVVKLTTTL
jgi:predicted anti-sigma-YlaC factor YlaD